LKFAKNHGEEYKSFEEFLVKLEMISKNIQSYKDKIDYEFLDIERCCKAFYEELLNMHKKMKKIHFSNVNFSSSSGPNTFANRLAHSLSSRGYKIVNQNDEYDIFLCFIEPSSMPRRRSKFIHRLDGVWFKPSEFIEKIDQ
jgi:hypothetical protein